MLFIVNFMLLEKMLHIYKNPSTLNSFLIRTLSWIFVPCRFAVIHDSRWRKLFYENILLHFKLGVLLFALHITPYITLNFVITNHCINFHCINVSKDSFFPRIQNLFKTPKIMIVHFSIQTAKTCKFEALLGGFI